MLSINIEYSDFGAKIVFLEEHRTGILKKKTYAKISLREWSEKNKQQITEIVIAELNLLKDTFKGGIVFTKEGVDIAHFCLAKLSSNSLKVLELPDNPSSKFLLNLSGSIASDDFNLKYKWKHLGSSEEQGALLKTTTENFIIPDPVFQIIELIRKFKNTALTNEEARWELIAKVKNLIDNRELIDLNFSEVSRRELAELQGVLREITIKTATALSLDVQRTATGVSFKPILFGKQSEDAKERLSESDGLLDKMERVSFENGNQSFGHFEKAKKTYLLRQGEYLLIEDDLLAALEIVKDKQKSSPAEREEFAANPGKAFDEYFENVLDKSSEGTEVEKAIEVEEKVEKIVKKIFLETEEFSKRVIQIGLWIPPILPYVVRVDNEWVPETFGVKIGDKYVAITAEEVNPLIDKVNSAIENGEKSIVWSGVKISATDDTVAVLEQLDGLMKPDPPETNGKAKIEIKQKHVLLVKENFDDLNYVQDYVPRQTKHITTLSKNITTTLKQHQSVSFKWMLDCYLKGLPGILNADDQGLGKTLQSIAFMAWLQEHQKFNEGGSFRPILVVAPTSLLLNWQEEVNIHMNGEKLGTRIEAYGSGLKGLRTNLKGIDTDDSSSETRLDFSKFLRSDKPSPTWILTTYKTLTNYAQSFAKISFATVIFDEIQNIKNPGTLQNNAANNLKADFKIGLTGTPVENSLSDLWSIMDTLVPGYLGSLKKFNEKFSGGNLELLKELYDRIFHSTKGNMGDQNLPSLGIRRMKSEAAADLPLKRYEKYPSEMIAFQADAYSQMIDQLNRTRAEGGGNAFTQINSLRSLSLHPERLELAYKDPEGIYNFINKSARIMQSIKILESIKERKEKVLVFLETREMQYLLQEFFRSYFKLDKVDIINGDVTIPRRAQIVKDFQEKMHIAEFDMLILGPKSAGVGLTLTAATHVIHLSRWWNPAVEEQCNDRVYRIGQERDVTIHIPLAVHPHYKDKSFDCILNNIMHRKRELFQGVLMPQTQSNEEEARGIWDEIVAEDATFLPIIDGQTGVQFEHWVSETAKRKGPWKTSITNVTGDGGADVILNHLERNSEFVIIQAKHTSNSEQNLQKSAVEEVINSKAYYPNLKNIHLVVITNYEDFSQPAKDLAIRHNVKLVARDDLCLWPNHII